MRIQLRLQDRLNNMNQTRCVISNKVIIGPVRTEFEFLYISALAKNPYICMIRSGSLSHMHRNFGLTNCPLTSHSGSGVVKGFAQNPRVGVALSLRERLPDRWLRQNRARAGIAYAHLHMCLRLWVFHWRGTHFVTFI